MISIIVPVYNAEEYLRDTIYSILDQDYKDIELLLINDGSKDKSLEICNSFQKIDRRVRVFDQKNSGVSAARNRGLKEARGEYIAFADADDLLEQDMLSVLYNCAKSYDADIVSCGAGVVENGKIVQEEYGTNAIYEYDMNAALTYFLTGIKVNIGVWTKLFRRELIKNIVFLEDKRINEDKYFIFEALMKADKFVVHDVTKYLYCKREGSATMRKFDERWFDSLDIADLMNDRITSEKPELKYFSDINMTKSYYWLLLKMYKSIGSIEQYPGQYKRIVNFLKRVELWKMQKYLTKNMFWQLFMLKISEPLLRNLKQKGK